MSDLTPDQLRQLADDMEQRPEELCWQWRNYKSGSKAWWDCTPEDAIARGMLDHIEIRRKPSTRKVEIEVPESVSSPEFTPEGSPPPRATLSIKTGVGWWQNIHYPTQEDAEAACVAVIKALGGGK